MIERVAEAVYQVHQLGLQDRIIIAKAAILAMREPTGNMITQGRLAIVAITNEDAQPQATYKAMIDAALKE